MANSYRSLRREDVQAFPVNEIVSLESQIRPLHLAFGYIHFELIAFDVADESDSLHLLQNKCLYTDRGECLLKSDERREKEIAQGLTVFRFNAEYGYTEMLKEKLGGLSSIASNWLYSIDLEHASELSEPLRNWLSVRDCSLDHGPLLPRLTTS